MHQVIPNQQLRLGMAIEATTPRGYRTAATVTELGARNLTITTTDHGAESFDRLTVVAYTSERVEHGWCPECRSRQVIEDASDESAGMRPWGEIEVWVTRFSCGHTTQGPERVVGPAPGGDAAREATEQRAVQQRLAREAQAIDQYGL